MSFPKVTVGSFQLVLFIKEFLKPLKKMDIAASISKAVRPLDVDPTILPFPDDVPGDAPRIILDGNQYKCNVSLKRVDFFRFTEAGELEEKLSEFIEMGKKLSQTCVNDLGFLVNRVGFVTAGNLVIDPFEFAKQYLLKDDISAHGFDLGLLFQPEIAGFEANKWVKVKNEGERIKFMIDFNLKEDKDVDLSAGHIVEVLDDIGNKFREDKYSLFEIK